MKALVLRGPNTRFELTEVPDPVAGAGEAVARVIAVDVALVARGEVWPLVSDIRPLEEAEALHERVERGEVTGRAALLIG